MSRVVYISTDGLRPDALAAADTPNLQAAMERGAHTLSARSVMPCITLPCHMSIFHSIPPERHGVLVNTYQPMARPVRGLIEVLHGAGKRCASFYTWEPLRDVGRPKKLALSKYIAYERDPEAADDRVVLEALPYLRSAAFDFVFLHLGTVDEVGHDHGWMSDRYLSQVEKLDALIGQLLGNLTDDAVALIHSDHGGHLRDHGTDIAENMTIPWMAMGPGIVTNRRIERPVSLLDTAPTIARIMNVEPDPVWEGSAVEEIFAT